MNNDDQNIIELRARIAALEDEVLRINYRNEALVRAGDEMYDTLNSTYTQEMRNLNQKEWDDAKTCDVLPSDAIYRKFLLREVSLRRNIASLIEAGFDLRWYLDGSEAALKAKELWDKAVANVKGC